MSNFWPIVIVILLVNAFVSWHGEKLVEKFLGRQPEAENRIFYAGASTFVMVAILLPAIQLSSNAGPLYFTIVFCIAMTVGSLVAQSLFGRKSST